MRRFIAILSALVVALGIEALLLGLMPLGGASVGGGVLGLLATLRLRGGARGLPRRAREQMFWLG